MPARSNTRAKHLSEADWNRIYAFIWKKYQEGEESYKNDFEKDPKKAVKRIVNELNKTTSNKKIPPITYTALFNIDVPKDLTDEQLDAIIKGEAVAFLQVRLCC